MTRGSRWKWAAAAALLLAPALVYWGSGQRRTSYEGRSLEEWLEQAVLEYDDGDPGRQAVTNAILHFGTNALPDLLSWIAYERPAWKNRLVPLARKAPAGLEDNPLVNSIYDVKEDRRIFLSLAGFEILGPIASPAIPELNRLVRGSSSRSVRCNAIAALQYIGESGFGSLAAVLADPRNANRKHAAFYIGVMGKYGRLGPHAHEAIGLLIGCLSSTDLDLARAAAIALGEIHQEPERVNPALTGCLADRRKPLQDAAARALGRYREVAGTAEAPLPAPGTMASPTNGTQP